MVCQIFNFNAKVNTYENSTFTVGKMGENSNAQLKLNRGNFIYNYAQTSIVNGSRWVIAQPPQILDYLVNWETVILPILVF